MIKCFTNVLNQEEQKYAIEKTIFGSEWGFTGYSNPSDLSVNHIWYMDLSKDSFFVNTMFLKIKELVSEDVELLRVYANGQTHGVCGKIHTDSEDPNDPNEVTFLYYPASSWDAVWGGFTVFYVDGEVLTRFPYPNSGVYFDANILHYGLEPSKHCPHLRVSIAFKLKRKSSYENNYGST